MARPKPKPLSNGQTNSSPQSRTRTSGVFGPLRSLGRGPYARDELGTTGKRPTVSCATSRRNRARRPPASPIASTALSDWYAGDFVGARSHLERALAIFDPERDADLAFRFDHDAGVGVMSYLSIDAVRARQLRSQLEARLRKVRHVATFRLR